MTDGLYDWLHGRIRELEACVAEVATERNSLRRELQATREERDQARADAEADNTEAIRARAERDEVRKALEYALGIFKTIAPKSPAIERIQAALTPTPKETE